MSELQYVSCLPKEKCFYDYDSWFFSLDPVIASMRSRGKGTLEDYMNLRVSLSVIFQTTRCHRPEDHSLILHGRRSCKGDEHCRYL